MQPQTKVRLVLVALCALLGSALGCEMVEDTALVPSPRGQMRGLHLKSLAELDPDACKERCCQFPLCDTAVYELKGEHGECHLYTCGIAPRNVCIAALKPLEDPSADYTVFNKTEAPALHIVPLLQDLSTSPENQDQESTSMSPKNQDQESTSMSPENQDQESTSMSPENQDPESTSPEKQRNSIINSGVCAQPKEVGPCRAAFPRFYFDPESGSCKKFTYGGCRGNDNNFESRGECEENCSGGRTGSDGAEAAGDGKRQPQKEMTQDDYKELCQSPLVVGPCRAAFPRWFFDHTTGVCQRFIYGGCRGNKNNYESEDDCKSACSGVKVLPSKKIIIIPQESAQDNGEKVLPSKKIAPQESAQDNAQCEAAPDSGPCRAAFTLFYFDPETQSCKTFIYGGCRGNANRYNSEGECVERCTGTGAAEGRGQARHRWTAAFFLFLSLAAVSFLLLTALIFITIRRNRTPKPALSIRSDREELLPDSERSSVDSLPLPESPTQS